MRLMVADWPGLMVQGEGGGGLTEFCHKSPDEGTCRVEFPDGGGQGDGGAPAGAGAVKGRIVGRDQPQAGRLRPPGGA